MGIIGCGSSYAQVLTLLVACSMLAVGLAKTVIVGGSDGWRFGINYANWTCQNGPFFVDDTLVFKYDPPTNGTFPHSVYLLPNYQSLQKCDLKKATMVGSVTQGGGQGFSFKLKKSQPYFFVCPEHAGSHCQIGLMKFAVMPLPRCYV